MTDLRITESTIEQATLAWFDELGYTVLFFKYSLAY